MPSLTTHNFVSCRVLLLTSVLLLGARPTVADVARSYHAFELGVAKEAGTLLHLRWHYGSIQPGEKPLAVGTGIPFMLQRQLMPVPEFFEASWQSADGIWHLARLPVRQQLQRAVEGHSVLFMIEEDGVRGELVTYTPRGDQREMIARVRATIVDAAAAEAVEGAPAIVHAFHGGPEQHLAQSLCIDAAQSMKTDAYPDTAGLRGITPLARAVGCGSVADIKALLAAGANPDQTIGNERTSLVYLAASRDDPGPLQALLDAGAEANAYSLNSERTAISQALVHGIETGDWRHWQLLLAKVDVNLPHDKFGETIAVRAARLNQFERVAELLDHGYDYRLASLGRAVEVAENLTEPFATWQRRVLDKLKARGVSFPVGPLMPQPISEAELLRLPANRR